MIYNYNKSRHLWFALMESYTMCLRLDLHKVLKNTKKYRHIEIFIPK